MSPEQQLLMAELQLLVLALMIVIKRKVGRRLPCMHVCVYALRLLMMLLLMMMMIIMLAFCFAL